MAFKKATKNSTGTNGGVKMNAPLLDAGGYPARLLQIIDLGLQPGSVQYPDPSYKLEFVFECLDEFMLSEEGAELENEPRRFSWEVSYNKDGYMGDRSNIYKIIDALDGFEKDLTDLLGLPCTVSLIQKNKASKPGEKYNRIAGITAMRVKDVEKAPKLTGTVLFFDLDEPDLEIYKTLTSRGDYCQQQKIKTSLEIHLSPLAKLLGIKPPVVEEVKDAVEDAAEELTELAEPANLGGAEIVETEDNPFE